MRKSIPVLKFRCGGRDIIVAV